MASDAESKEEVVGKPTVLSWAEALRLAYLPSKELAEEYKAKYDFNFQISGKLPANDKVPKIYQGGIHAYNQGLLEVAVWFFYAALEYYDTPQKEAEKLKILQP